MYTSKMFVHLKVLKKEEWSSFQQFLRGSKGDRSDVFRLFNEIYKTRKNLRSEKLDVNFMNQLLFPHLSRKSFQNIMSVLKQQIEEFWIWCDLKEDRARMELHRLEALNKRGFYKESNKSLARLEKMTDNNKNLDLWNDYYKSRGMFEIYFSNNPIKENLELSVNILSSSIDVNVSFLANILLYYKAELYNMAMMVSGKYKDLISKIEAVNLYPKPTQLNESLKSEVELLSSGYGAFPGSLHALIQNDSISLAPYLEIAYFYHIRRYMILEVRSGKSEFISILEGLIKWSLDSGLLIYRGELAINYFVSDISILCALNGVDQAETYKDKYQSKLNIDLREEGIALGEMMINFVKKDYDQVIEAYTITVFKKASRKLQAAGLFLRGAYDIYGNDASFFEHHLRNLSDFIRRNKTQLSVQQVRAWKNFIYIFRLMVKGTNEAKVLKSIEGSKDIIHRKWLYEKIKGEAL